MADRPHFTTRGSSLFTEPWLWCLKQVRGIHPAPLPPARSPVSPWPAAVALGVCCGLRAHLRDNEDRQPATDHLLCSCQVPVSESAFSTHPPSFYLSACSMTPPPDQMEVQHTLLFIIHITALLEHDLQLKMRCIMAPYWLSADECIFYIGFGRCRNCICSFPLFLHLITFAII